MSKELEALKEIYNGMYNKQGFIKEFKTIEQALTPPTSDEVCEALSKHLERKVKIDIDITFYYSDKNGLGEYDKIICGYGWEHEHHTITFEINLPPHLITLIGRFYEGMEKK